MTGEDNPLDGWNELQIRTAVRRVVESQSDKFKWSASGLADRIISELRKVPATEPTAPEDSEEQGERGEEAAGFGARVAFPGDGWVFTGRMRWFTAPKRFPVLQQEFRRPRGDWAIHLDPDETEWRDVPEVEE